MAARRLAIWPGSKRLPNFQKLFPRSKGQQLQNDSSGGFGPKTTLFYNKRK